MAVILLVEDYQNLQKIYKETLEAARHTVHVASDGLEALEIAKTTEVDLILLDLLMPRSSGLDFLNAYKIQEHPKTKVIILTNVYSGELLNRTLTLGASQYLIKADITPKKLTEIVDEALNKPKPAA